MKIAILSDIHDNIWNLDKTLKAILGKKVNTVICCGDYCSPSTFKQATEKFKKAYCVWGNVDGEKKAVVRNLLENNIKHVNLLDDFGEIIIEKRKIAIIHNHLTVDALAKSGLYDAIFFGTHQTEKKRQGRTLLLNSGAVCGFKDGIPSKATFAIYDTKTNSAEIIEIK